MGPIGREWGGAAGVIAGGAIGFEGEVGEELGEMSGSWYGQGWGDCGITKDGAGVEASQSEHGDGSRMSGEGAGEEVGAGSGGNDDPALSLGPGAGAGEGLGGIGERVPFR